MDLFIQPTSGGQFSIEVGYFDTVLEIKEKIQKYQDIPVSRQTLVFDGVVLDDEFNVHYSEILDRPHMQLIVAPDPESHIINTEESSPSSKKILLHLKMLASELRFTFEMDTNDTIRRLKEEIHLMQGFPISQLILRANGIELHDPKTIHDSALVDRSEIEVSIRPPLYTTGSLRSSGNATGSKKLRVLVLTRCGTKKIPLEVNPTDNVAELRKDLEKLNHDLQLELPPEGYFVFFHVLDHCKMLMWNCF